ncbi:MAG: M50 family metallopeptidase [Clostridium sp.]|nr:M50 family metallopeptidase [Clostridium sp.]MEE0128093.1 site-2 protease family protein [Clostridia bacterium]
MEFKIDIKIFLVGLIFFIVNQFYMYILFMIFVIIHECFHLLAGIVLGYKVKNLKIMPLGVSVGFKEKEEEYNTKIRKSNMNNVKKIIILLMGPISNIVIAGMFLVLNKPEPVYINIVIAIFNLLPIYPLDGGQILNRILRIFYSNFESYKISNSINNIMMSILTALASIVLLYTKNIAIIFIVIFMWYLIIKENIKYKEMSKYFKSFHNLDKKTNYNV